MTVARPILFSAAMVRALIRECHQRGAGKTQTRRICKYPVYSNGIRYDAATGDIPCHCDELPPSAMLMDVTRSGKRLYTTSNVEGWAEACPYGVDGDALWVREAWAHVADYEGIDPGIAALQSRCFYRADHPGGVWSEKDPTKSIRWRPSIHMPREYSRLTLRITDVRVERLQDISEADAIAEGVHKVGQRWEVDGIVATPVSAVNAFRALWEYVNGRDSWAANPWVWAITFRPELRNVDDVIRAAA